MASDLMQKARNEAINYTTAAALRHAAECVDELVEKGEPMGDQQTNRRAYRPADKLVCDSDVSGEDFEEAMDIVGETIALATKHYISGAQAAKFYRNKADSI